jgi:hypothetical protein
MGRRWESRLTLVENQNQVQLALSKQHRNGQDDAVRKSEHWRVSGLPLLRCGRGGAETLNQIAGDPDRFDLLDVRAGEPALARRRDH